MPSNKLPLEVVQPGPGRLPDGTVPATALTFPIAAGSNAALQAHITDPVDAHESSAIGTPNFGGFGTRTSPAGSVESALIDAYDALNTQAVWVLHVAGTIDNADFFGSSALASAMNQIVLNGARRILFLKAGVYTWTDSQIFDGVTIIGDGIGTVEIRNTSGGLRIGSNATFKNVLINITGDLTITSSGTGRNLLQNVRLDVDGIVNVQTQYNEFAQVTRTGSPLFVNVVEGHNTFTQVGASQLSDSSAVGGNAYQDLVLDGPPRNSTTNVLFVSASYASFNGLMLAPTGSFTAQIANITGTFNSFRDVNIGPITSSTGAVLELAGNNNNLDFVRIHDVAASTYGVFLTGNFNSLSNIRANLVVSQFTTVRCTGDSNRWDGLEAQSTTATTEQILSLTTAAALNEFRNISITSPTVTAEAVIGIEGPDNVCEKVTIASVPASLGCIRVSSQRNTLRDLTLNTVTATGAIVAVVNGSNIRIDGLTINVGTVNGAGSNTISISAGTDIKLSNVTLLSAGGVAASSTLVAVENTASDVEIRSIAFYNCLSAQTLMLLNASRCTASSVQIRNSFTTIGSGFINIAGTNCTVDGVVFDSMSGVNIPLVKLTGTHPVVRNIQLTSFSSAFGGPGFNIIEMGGGSSTGAIADGVRVTNLTTLSSPVLFDFAAGATNVIIRNVILDTIGSSGPQKLANIGTNVCSNIRLENWTINAVTMAATSLFDIDTAFADDVVFDDIKISGIQYAAGGPAGSAQFYFNFTRLNDTLRQGVTLKNCRVVNTDTVFTHVLLNAGTVINPVRVESCEFQSTITSITTPCVTVSSCSRMSFTNCTITAPNTFKADNSGVTLTNCVFKSVFVSGVTGAQLFAGWGRTGTSVVPAEALVIRNCTMLTSACNNSPTSTTSPNVFFGGSTTTAPANHGAVLVDGLKIGRNPTESFSFWQRSPLLTIDVASQHIGVQSSFKNITIDMENIPYTGDGSGSAVFAPNVSFNGSGVVAEINGPDSTDPRSRASTVVKGLSFLRVPRNGGAGNRAVLLARGVTLENLVVDAAAGTAATWGAVAVGVNNCVLDVADFWQTTSLPVGFYHLYGEDNSILRHVTMRNFAVAPSEQFGLVACSCSSLYDSHFDMPEGSHIPIGSAMFSFSGNANDDGCWMVGNKILYTHNATSAADFRMVINTLGQAVRVLNNRMINRAQALASGYSGTPGSSNGGGCHVDLSGDNTIFEGNYMEYEWSTGTDVISSVTSSGEHNKILNNHITNTANTSLNAGGSNRVAVTAGLYSNVSNNNIIGSNTGGRILIDTSAAGGSSIVMGNQVDNISNVGVITLHASDKPTPTGSYNFLT